MQLSYPATGPPFDNMPYGRDRKRGAEARRLGLTPRAQSRTGNERRAGSAIGEHG